MTTKRELIEMAFAENGLATSAFDLQPEEVLWALSRLDMQMATWDGNGIRVGYNLSSDDPDADSGLADSVAETVAMHLAIRIAPRFGKAPSVDTRRAARDGYDRLLIDAAQPLPTSMPNTLPVGAGNRSPIGTPFFVQTTPDPLTVSNGGELEITE